MKKFLLAIVAITTLSVGSAVAGNNLLGLFNVGGRIGIISSSEGIPTTSDGVKDAIKAEGTGWTGNVFARINIPKLPLYIQPELQYTTPTPILQQPYLWTIQLFVFVRATLLKLALEHWKWQVSDSGAQWGSTASPGSLLEMQNLIVILSVK